MIRTVKIRFREPLTNIWVEGKDEWYASTEENLYERVSEFELFLSRLYGGDIQISFAEE